MYKCTSFSIGNGDFGNSLNAGPVVNTPIGIQDATVAMNGVGTEADVAGDHQIGKPLPEQRQSLYDGISRAVCVFSLVILWTRYEDAQIVSL